MWVVGFNKINFRMFKLKKVQHNNITQELLDEIISVKSSAWPYSYEKQLDWIHLNIKNEDFHILLYLNDSVVGYLNLLKIRFTIDNYPKDGYGIGNVCTKEKRKGWGQELIARTNLDITQNEKVGLLFCRESLVNFYSLKDWCIIEKNKLDFSFSNDSVHTMIFNYEEEFRCLVYKGNPF